jgi:hypothetical protein
LARVPRPSDSFTNSTNGISNILELDSKSSFSKIGQLFSEMKENYSIEAGLQVLLFQTNPSEQARQLSAFPSHIWQEAWQRAQRNWFILAGVWYSVAIKEPKDML